MRYLPVFLDLQTGLVALVGQGELARAKLRVLVAAGARIRWYATQGEHRGEHDVQGLEPAQLARIEFAKGDPLAADLTGVVAVFCAGAGDVGVAMSARAKSVKVIWAEAPPGGSSIVQDSTAPLTSSTAASARRAPISTRSAASCRNTRAASAITAEDSCPRAPSAFCTRRSEDSIA